MKKSLIALAVLAISTAAFANGGEWVEPSTPTVAGSQGQQQQQNSANTNTITNGDTTAYGGQSSAISIGEGGNAAGGTASASGGHSSATTGPSYAANGDQTSTFSSKMLSLPQPVWTQVPTAFGCIVTDSKAGALGWNFVSGSSTTQQSEVVCTTIRMAEAATAWCQYATAAFLNKRAFEQMYPGEKGDFFLNAGRRDLTVEECEATKRPVMIMERRMASPAPVAPVETHVTIDNSCAAPAPVASKAPARKRKYTPVPTTVCK